MRFCSSGIVNDGLKHFLSTASKPPSTLSSKSSIDFITNEIGVMLFSLMLRPMKDLALEAPLVALGVDLLVAIELRNWLRLNLGLDVGVIDIMGSASIIHLGEKVTARLLEKYSEAAV
jgi:hypothetical protein